MTRPLLSFLWYLLRQRGPRSSLTGAEAALLEKLATGRRCVVEVGVFEGATSAVLANVIAADGRLWLIDPFYRHTRPERLLGISFSEYIARRSVRPWQGRVNFVRQASVTAAAQIGPNWAADLIFIDADHSYEAVRADFMVWSPHLSTRGMLAFHDSRRCDARPDLRTSDGPVRLVDEIRRGEYGNWKLATAVDSISVIRPHAIASTTST